MYALSSGKPAIPGKVRVSETDRQNENEILLKTVKMLLNKSGTYSYNHECVVYFYVCIMSSLCNYNKIVVRVYIFLSQAQDVA